ncbi:MAG: DUF2062 domain-containing protein [Kiritimatiellae bacterium]|nr:DUF2062 domain-containing protein [Kiritimatiellia bacterium]
MSTLSIRWQQIKEKILSGDLSPERIAAGWALGMFAGCAVPFGLQLAVTVPIAKFAKISMVGATVGTLITNPVTIFFIYPAQTWAVYRLFFGQLDYNSLRSIEWTRETVMSFSTQLMASYFLGGLFLAFILTPITYFAVKRFVVFSRKLKG